MFGCDGRSENNAFNRAVSIDPDSANRGKKNRTGHNSPAEPEPPIICRNQGRTNRNAPCSLRRVPRQFVGRGLPVEAEFKQGDWEREGPGRPLILFAWQFHDLDFANADFATRVVLLEGEVSFLEGLLEIKVLVQLVSIDGDLDSRYRTTPPHSVTD